MVISARAAHGESSGIGIKPMLGPRAALVISLAGGGIISINYVRVFPTVPNAVLALLAAVWRICVAAEVYI